MTECSAHSFSCYVTNILQQKPDDQDTRLCKVWLNPEVKVEELKYIGVTLQWLLSMIER